MAGEEAPKKVQEANDARWREYKKMVRMERKLQRKILEDPGPRPAIPEPMQHPVLPGRHSREQCGACNPCKAQDCGRCRGCLEEGPIGTRVQNRGTEAPEICEAEQRRCVAWTEPPPPPPSSWGASSLVSEATAENLLSGADELMAQQDKMSEATVRLIAVVSEVRGGPWEASPGLTERALTNWMGKQEGQVAF